MERVSSRTLDFLDRHVSALIVEKYGFTEKESLHAFILSETYQMLCDPELEIYKMSPYILFDMWESERVTGDPRNSQYLRTE